MMVSKKYTVLELDVILDILALILKFNCDHTLRGMVLSHIDFAKFVV